jgi:tetratricopeptide (TPR) repeat protein
MRHLLSAWTALAILAGLAPVAADDRTDCNQGIFEQRIAACTRIIGQRGEGSESIARAYSRRGIAYRNRDDDDHAIADFTKAIELDPNRASYYRGLLNAAKSEQDLAIAEYNEAIRLDPNDAVAYNSRGNAFFAKGDHVRAIADYSEAIRLDHNLAVAYNNRGNAYGSKGELDRAILDLDEAIRLDPNFVVARVNRGNTYRRKGEFDRAITELTKAIESDPKYARPYRYRGWVYQNKGEHDAAIADFSKAIELEINSKNSARAYESRGFSHWRKNEPNRAIANYDKALELDPKYASVYNNRGNAYGSKGELDRAIADYTKAIELEPKNPWPYNNRGHAYGRKGDLDRAIVDYDKALELDPKYALALSNRGNAYERKKANELAITDYRKILALPAPSTTDQQRQELTRQRIARLTEPQPAPRTPPPLAAQRVALVIGNSNYANADVLVNPKNDASATAAALRRLGFAQVVERYDLTHELMVQALKDFGDLAEGAEWAVVFFAGHGMEMNGVTYLIPSDAVLKRDTHVIDETISLTQVQTKVDATTKLSLVILDSCRNNPFSQRMVRSGGGARSISRGLANVEPSEGNAEGNLLIVYAAKHGTTAEDGAGEHSPFTEALLAHIEDPALEINFLFRKVRDEVLAKTQHRQEPYQYGSLSSEPLYFKAR